MQSILYIEIQQPDFFNLWKNRFWSVTLKQLRVVIGRLMFLKLNLIKNFQTLYTIEIYGHFKKEKSSLHHQDYLSLPRQMQEVLCISSLPLV